jgi:predicted pyridoxine 5'-phosphate oxidase superfamily flavin-nucleotide-binding protein
MKLQISSSLKDIIESNPLALSTVMLDGNPNVIGVACVKVVSDDQVLISDIYMHQTIEDISHHPRVALVVWNKESGGHKLIGVAQHFNSGEWLDKVKSIPENKNMPVKGAILVTVSQIIQSA